MPAKPPQISSPPQTREGRFRRRTRFPSPSSGSAPHTQKRARYRVRSAKGSGTKNSKQQSQEKKGEHRADVKMPQKPTPSYKVVIQGPVFQEKPADWPPSPKRRASPRSKREKHQAALTAPGGDLPSMHAGQLKQKGTCGTRLRPWLRRTIVLSTLHNYSMLHLH